MLGRAPRDLKNAIVRLNRERLTRLFELCQEIPDSMLKELFEEYRYGSNPSFFIFLCGAGTKNATSDRELRPGLERAFKEFNASRPDVLPRVRQLEINDMTTLPEQSQVIEVNYKYLERLDYVDENENAVSTYETRYGFFWINTSEKYVIVQSSTAEILKTIRKAVEEAASTTLSSLVISRAFRHALALSVQRVLAVGQVARSRSRLQTLPLDQHRG